MARTRSRTRISTLFFDIGNVLMRFDWKAAYKIFSRRSGKSHKELERVFWGVSQQTGLEHLYERGMLTTPQFHAAFTEQLFPVTFGELRFLWNGIFSPIVPMHELAWRLRGAGYKLFIISNTDDLHFTHLLNTYRVFDAFDGFALSHIVKALKPEPKIFETALALAGVPGSECLYADDVPEYVAAFRKRHGVDGFVFQEDRFAEFEEFLRSRGMRW